MSQAESAVAPGPAPAGQQDEPDSLEQASDRLRQVDELPLDRHPEAFAAIDAELRRALQPSPRRG